MRIVIAEDDAASRLLLADVLTGLGHEVVMTADGEEAWEILQNESIQVLISDWIMPNLDGLGLCRLIRAQGATQYTYIILLTVVGGKANYLEAMNAGVDDFITKPFDADRLQARLRVAERILSLQRELTHLELTRDQVIQRERLRALGQMASGIAHDFTNTLSCVVGFSSMLLGRPAELENKERLKHYLGMICTAGQDAAQMVRRLREFYRPRTGVEAFVPVSLNEVITTTVSLTEPKWKAQAQAAGHTIQVETVLADTPIIAGNPAELRDVLTNLVFNAVDAMVHGGTLTLRTRADAAGSSVVLEVSDTGVGMTREVRQRCLEPFFTTKGAHGTGLGLAMTYGIIQRHRGSIDIESEPGAGTTFSIRFPVLREPAAGGGSPDAGVSRRLHVLVVEDEPVPLEVLVELLVGDGHTVETATNGREGLQRFQAGWYDVVVTDRAMPEMSGDELAFNIKRTAPNKPVIIMLTGFATVEDPPLGVDVVISKPVTLSGLREALALAG